MKKKDRSKYSTKKSDTKESIKRSKKDSLNKKRLNNKVLKAKGIISQNRERLKYGGKIPEIPRVPMWKRIYHLVRKIILWVLGIALAALLISFLVVRIQGGTPTVFGYSIQRIASGSMEPELKIGDMIISKTVSSPDEIHADDIITYQGDADHDYQNITHRVVEAPHLDEKGEYVLTTKGDANPVEDKEIHFSDVRFRYIAKYDILNKLYKFFLSPAGILTFFAIIILSCFDELLTIAKVLTGNYHDPEAEKEQEQEERIKAFEEQERRRKEELREKKRLNPRKYDSTSNRKKKNRKKNRGSAVPQRDEHAPKHAKGSDHRDSGKKKSKKKR